MKAANPEARYDVIVLGGGPAGSTTAALLARKAVSVLVVEEKERGLGFKVGETVPGVAGATLARAGFPGLLQKVPQLRCSGNRSSWGSPKLHSRPGLLDPYGGGAHLDRARLDLELLRESAAAGAQILHGARFESAEKSKGIWTIRLRRGSELLSIGCDSVVDSTGRKACFAQSRGARRVMVDRQIAIVSLFSAANIEDDDLTTTIEATPTGWWYSARLPGQKRIVAFFTDGGLLSRLDVRSTDGFIALMRRSAHVVEFLRRGYSHARTPTVLLANTSYLMHSAGDGWCAAGDAASALDPLASAGIVNAISAGSRAASLVLSGFKNTEDYSGEARDKAMSDIRIRQSYYRMETRWPREPFWVLRQQPQTFQPPTISRT